MLNKLVTHLKNIIFFKLVVYTILIIALFTLVKIFQEDLASSTGKHKRSYSFLQNATIKLESIIDFDDKILETNKKYNQLVEDSTRLECVSHFNLINNIQSISSEYQLFEPIDITISKIFDNELLLNTNGHIKLNYYEMDIHFKATNNFELLDIAQQIYQRLPQGSVVMSTNIHTIDAITPQIIDQLNATNSPGFLDVRMKIHLREIAYEN